MSWFGRVRDPMRLGHAVLVLLALIAFLLAVLLRLALSYAEWYGEVAPLLEPRSALLNALREARDPWLSSIALRVAGNVGDPLAAASRLCDYVGSVVRYVPDPPVPYPPPLQHLLLGSVRRPWIANVYQPPLDTLRRSAGDCEDMALLLAALIEAWSRVKGSGAAPGLLLAKLVDGRWHAATLLAAGNRYAVLDPALGLCHPVESGSIAEVLQRYGELIGLREAYIVTHDGKLLRWSPPHANRDGRHQQR